MRLLILIFCLQLSALSIGFCAPAFSKSLAFQRQQPVSASSWTPTNMPGYNPVSWYVAADYVTNGGTSVSLPDRWTNSYTLTNLGAASVWPVFDAVGLDSQPALKFNGAATGQYLTVSNYIASQPYEVIMVVVMTNTGSLKHVFDSVNGSFRCMARMEPPQLAMFAGSVVYSTALETNYWMVLDVIFSGTSSVTYTNNSAGATVSAGTQKTAGLTIGSKQGLAAGQYGNINVAEIITFGNGGAIPGTNSTARSEIYNGLKAKYPSLR